MNLKLVAEVDDNGVTHRGDINPLVILEELQSTDFVILEEEDDATSISVSSEALDEIRLGTRRVVANFGPKIWSLGTIEHLLQVPFLQPKILTQQV